MFGKINKRYFKDQNKFGSILFIVSILLVLSLSSIIGFYKGVMYLGNKIEKQSSTYELKHFLNGRYTFENAVYLGETDYDPLGMKTYHRHKFRVYRVRGVTDTIIDEDTFILYSIGHNFEGSFTAYSVRASRQL